VAALVNQVIYEPHASDIWDAAIVGFAALVSAARVP